VAAHLGVVGLSRFLGAARANVARLRRRAGLEAMAALLVALAALAGAACGGGGGGGGGSGGGGGGGGGGGPTQPSPGITLTPASASPPAIVLATGAASTATTLVLEVRANQVTSLYGVAFDLQYPTAQLDFTAFRAGSFLGTGLQLSTQVFESSPGNLVVGLSKLGLVQGASGSGVLIELEFAAVANGTGNVGFSRNAAFAPDGATVPMSWAGGSVTVVR
jgi:hypothetical protein